MPIQAMQNRTFEPAIATSRVSGSRPAATGVAGQADRVVVSERARQLSAHLAASEGPELQLSPERLRQMIEQVEAAEAPKE